MKTPLLSLSLALASASLALAQQSTPPPAPPAQAGQTPSSGSDHAAAAAKPAEDATGPGSFWDWFVGDGNTPGAYRAPEMPCSTVHDINGETSRTHRRKLTDRGQVYFASFILDVGANPKLCMYTDGPTIPAEAMLPMSPTTFSSWIGSHDPDQTVRSTMLDYIAAGSSTDDPVGRMTRDRTKFWAATLKAVLSDDAGRAEICARAMPKAPSCASEITSKTPDQLYQLGVAAAQPR
jgi:hypothetical protein